MPNHFHLIVFEREEGGIAKYMQRSLNAYTKYFNTKNDKSGHVFQGTYKAIHISDNDQLLYASAYVHRNARARNYPWSSFRDFVSINRWGDLLNSKVILEQFDNSQEYKKWADTSGAKDDMWTTEVVYRLGEDF